MAKASVKLICAKCGAEFKKEKYCTNRSAANSWEEWAKENFELCPDCEKEAYRKAQKEKGLLVSFELNRKATREKGVGVINACFSGDTYSRKEDLKKSAVSGMAMTGLSPFRTANMEFGKNESSPNSGQL